MTKNPKVHLEYISDVLESIKDNTPTSFEAFMSDQNAQDATLMRLQDIGEQLSRIRDQFPDYYEQNQHDSWHKFIGLRNIISHGYREIDFEIIWEVLQKGLPEFTKHLHSLK